MRILGIETFCDETLHQAEHCILRTVVRNDKNKRSAGDGAGRFK